MGSLRDTRYQNQQSRSEVFVSAIAHYYQYDAQNASSCIPIFLASKERAETLTRRDIPKRILRNAASPPLPEGKDHGNSKSQCTFVPMEPGQHPTVGERKNCHNAAINGNMSWVNHEHCNPESA
jgi:hypothetical protein